MTGVALELFFRFVLPSCESPKGIVDGDYLVRRFDAEYLSSGEFTYGRLCRAGGRWTINGAGWNSGFEYLEPDRRSQPLVALLGDSYLEGFYTDTGDHIDALLYRMYHGEVDFYTFAMSGAYLAQYVAMCRYIRDTFSPDAYVIFINSGDLEKSI